MSHHTCPVWIGYLLASPLRRWLQNPEEILAPYIRPGMRVLEIGPGMGFFTLPLARLAGAEGRVIAVDLQPRMLGELAQRARRAGLELRIETRTCSPDSLGVQDLAASQDFALLFAVAHEVRDQARLFGETAAALKPGGRALFAEPKGHVSAAAFRKSIEAAAQCGLAVKEARPIRRSRTAILEKPAPAR